MLTSITPLGERSRGGRWYVTATGFTLGAILTGSAFGGLLGGLGSTGPWSGTGVATTVFGLAAIVGAALDAHIGGVSVPTSDRQVNDLWLYKYRGWVYGFGFGAQLGLGVVTVVSSSLVYLTVLACFLSGSPFAGATIGLIAGAVRALALMQVARVNSFEELVLIDRRQERWEWPSELVAVLVLCSIAFALLVTGL
jgi:hypothetical protein